MGKESHGDWLATEHESDMGEQLNEKFEVSGIPSLVVLKGDGTLVTKGGRGDVSNHGKKALEFWSQTAIDLLKDQHFIKTDDSKVAAETVIESKKFIGFYFSAHWCPPCRGFTPKLKECYEKWKKSGQKIEVLFVTSDQNDKSFKEYFAEMGDWLAYPFGSPQIKKLKEKFNVRGIPTLVVIDENGKKIDDRARDTVQKKGGNAVKEWIK